MDWAFPWSGKLIHRKLYIIGNKLGQAKMGGAREEGTIFPEDWTVPPKGDPGVPLSQSQQKLPLEEGEGDTCSATINWLTHLWNLSW